MSTWIRRSRRTRTIATTMTYRIQTPRRTPTRRIRTTATTPTFRIRTRSDRTDAPHTDAGIPPRDGRTATPHEDHAASYRRPAYGLRRRTRTPTARIRRRTPTVSHTDTLPTPIPQSTAATRRPCGSRRISTVGPTATMEITRTRMAISFNDHTDAGHSDHVDDVFHHDHDDQLPTRSLRPLRVRAIWIPLSTRRIRTTGMCAIATTTTGTGVTAPRPPGCALHRSLRHRPS